MTETLRVFDMLSPNGSIALDLPREWARVVDQPSIRLWSTAMFGWHAEVTAAGSRVFRLVDHDHVDRSLLDPVRGVAPPFVAPAPGEEWDYLDQCYWGILLRHREEVFAVEADWELLEDRVGVPPQLVRPGHICVADVPVWWHRVPADAWRAAWSRTRAIVERGEHLTTKTPPPEIVVPLA